MRCTAELAPAYSIGIDKCGLSFCEVFISTLYMYLYFAGIKPPFELPLLLSIPPFLFSLTVT